MQSDLAPANTEARTGVIAPVMHHVNLKTIRLQELIDWYGTVVGMTPNHQFEGGAWLTNDAANHRLALLTVPGLEDDPERCATPACTTPPSSTRQWTTCSTPTSA
jgi:hypothetical protein